MKRVLLIATTTGYQIRSFGESAEKLGIRLVFASDRCDQLDDPWWDQAVPVRFHRERESVDALLSAFNGAPPDGILAVGDRPAVLAAHAARAFDIPGNPPDAASACRNKLASRGTMRAAGLPTPWFRAVPTDADPGGLSVALPYPVVIKPLALSGSRGVIRVNDAAEFVSAFERLRRLLRSDDVRGERDAVHELALVESYVPGTEFAVEALLERGTLRPLAIFDKPDPLDGPFFEETIYVTPSRVAAEVQRRIVDAVAAAAAALGLHHGPVHAECRVDRDTVYVLEVAARPIGGLCSRTLRFESAGDTMALEEVLLRHAIGEDVSSCAREQAASGVMMIPIPRRGLYRSVNGIDAARAVAAVEDIRITAKPGAALVPLPEGKSYLGFIFARARAPEAVERALREAHAQLTFVIDREVPIA